MKRPSPKPIAIERIAAALTDEDFDCESFRLKHVINIARGVGLQDWPLPRGSSWERCWLDIKDAVERGELPTGIWDPEIRWRTVRLDDLWAFAIARPARRWDWLREFCRRWAAGQGTKLPEAPEGRDGEPTVEVDPDAPQSEVCARRPPKHSGQRRQTIAVQGFINDVVGQFRIKHKKFPTPDELDKWLNDHYSNSEGTATGLPDCDDVTYLDGRFDWTDSDATRSKKGLKLSSLRRYLSRAP